MPEIKRNFLQGKMNKDLDERLVPNGQYRDALNIEISTSESSNVGSIQNILGNKYIDTYPSGAHESTFFPTNPTCVGSISDDKTDSIYWLVTGDELVLPHYSNGSLNASAPFYQKDMIIQYKNGNIKPVFVDITKSLLDSSGLSGNGSNTIVVPNLHNISVGMTVVGLTDTGSGIDTEFSTTVTGLGAFVANNVSWMANYSWVTQPNPTANPNNPFSVEIQGAQGPTSDPYNPNWLPTNVLLADAQFPGQFLSQGDVVSGPGFIPGTTVTNVVYPSSYPGHIEITLDQTPSTTGSYPWFTQVNIINPGSTMQVQVINNIITVPGAAYGNTPSNLGIQPGMEVVDTCIPNGTTIVSIDEVTSSTESYITLSNTPICNGGVMNVLGSGFTSEITVADIYSGGAPYPSTDYLYFYRPEVLSFDRNRLVTGLNIIDNMLFWTDNHSEPKKINIERSIEGTDESGLKHTNLINKSRDIDNINNVSSIEEKHITVIKKPPTNPPIIKTEKQIISKGFISGDVNVFHPNGALVNVGDIVTDVQLFSTEGAFAAGDIVFFQESVTNIDFPLPLNFTVKAELLNLSQSAPVGGAYLWDVVIMWVNPVGGTSSPTGWEAEQDISNQDKIFELKFPRFATRYKYEDGEYSTFSPFSEVCFEPGEFRYKPTEGYNLGMENIITKITLTNLVPKNIPKDVVQVDILYKESNSPNIYLVDSIKQDDSIPFGAINNEWNSHPLNTFPIGSSTGTYEITSDTLYAAVPANQLIRQWDNVPRKALSQEIAANRVIYGNYLQNYNLNREDNTEFKPNFNISLSSYSTGLNDFKSLKSQREYQVGVTYLDEFGRETPILTDVNSTIKIPKRKSKFANRLSIQLKGAPPAFAKAYKYYIKENSNEYYNLAMDRFYDADDGNVWLSFYSYDRNKIDEDTWLELKKTVDGAAVEEDAKYKVLAIENEAPDYIKTTRKQLLNYLHDDAATNPLFNDSNSYPIETRNYFVVSQDALLGGPAAEMDKLEFPLRVRLVQTANNIQSKWYDVDTITLSPAGATTGGDFNVKLETALGPDVDFVDSTTSGVLESGITLELTQGVIKNKPEFDGRFFVKILKDNRLKQHIITESNDTSSLVTVGFEPLYFFDQTVALPGDGSWTTTDYWTAANGGLPINYSGSEFYYDQGHPETKHADDFQNCKHKWRHYFGTGASNIAGEAGGPKWIIDKLGYAGKMPNHTSYQGWTPFNQNGTGEKPIPTSTSMSSNNTVGESGEGVNGNVIDISFVGIDQNTTPNFMTNPPVWQHYFDVGGYDGNSMHSQEANTVDLLETIGQRFKFEGDDEIYTIVHYSTTEIFNLMTNVHDPDDGSKFYKINGNNDYYVSSGSTNCGSTSDWYNEIGYSTGQCLGFPNRRKTWRIEVDKVIGAGTGFNPEDTADHETTVAIVFLDDEIESSDETKTTNPAIWETEPKPSTDIDLFYEASSVIPITLDENWDEQVLKPGMEITTQGAGNTLDISSGTPALLTGISGGNILVSYANVSNNLYLADNAILRFWDGNEYITVSVEGDQVGQYSGVAMLKIDPNFYNGFRTLPWFNCYSFGNGVESNRIRDDFNAVMIDKGAKVSTISPEPYKEERRGSGLIYSGLYNSNSGVNNLNQFIQAEKITKDLNPTYGSIQKLFTRRVSLVAFCEDRVIRILANKDALYNADGKMQLTSTNKVLGEAQPFEGDYGISKNPESFGKDSYRAYFTDKSRGAVLRLSKDGLTPISEYGMSDYFKDNLKLGNRLIGGYDDRKNEYNLTIKNFQAEDKDRTISFTETVKGWTSFKSFIPEDSVNLSSDYYTFKNGKLYKHYSPLRYSFNNSEWVDADEENAENYNVFYGVNSYDSSVRFILNDDPSAIKSFKTLNYEGSQSRINKFTTTTTTDAAGNVLLNIGDGDFYNLNEDIDPLTGIGIGHVSGWHVSNITTDDQQGSIKEFIEKENKWYNYILGTPKTWSNIDPEEFSFQGIGLATSFVDGELVGCMDNTALNYNANANVACSGCCVDVIYGCMDSTATNYDPTANQDDGSCYISGCTDSLMFNYNPNATVACNSCCIPIILGCTDPTMFNYDPAANTLDGSCIPYVYGCMDNTATNYNSLANSPCNGNNSCCVYTPILGCTDPLANNYDANATQDDGSCTYNTGCMDSGSMGQTWWTNNYASSTGVATYPAYQPSNYDNTAVVDDGSCIYPSGCTDPAMYNYDPSAVIDDGSCIAFTYGCMDNGSMGQAWWDNNGYAASTGIATYPATQASNYDPSANTDDGSCTYDVYGCTDPLANNYDPTATVDDGSCVICANITMNIFTNVSQPTSPSYNNGVITIGHNAGSDDLINNYNYMYDCVHSDGTVYTSGYGSSGGAFNFTNLPSGTYTMIATSANGCTTSVTVILHDYVVGCSDSQANNYDPNVTADDGSCVYSGCLDASSTGGISMFNHPNPGNNYVNPIAATYDCSDVLNGTDYSCCGYVPGCTDPTATNYNPLATQDDGTCYWEGCTDSGANNYNSNATVDDGSCEYHGCTDPLSLSYAGGNACFDGNGTAIPCTHNCDGTAQGTYLAGWNSCCAYCDPGVNALLDAFSSSSSNGESGLIGSFSSSIGTWDGELVIDNSNQNNTMITWNNTYVYPNQVPLASATYFSSTTALPPNNNIGLYGLPPGTYEVTIEQDNGCQNTYTETINEVVYGCMDSLASNYDSNATHQSDGTTTYNYTGLPGNIPVEDCTYANQPCCNVNFGSSYTVTDAVNGSGGEINNISAFNGGGCPQGSYGWPDYTISITGPGGYNNTIIFDGTNFLSLTGLVDGDYYFQITDSNPTGCTSGIYTVTVGNDITGCSDPAASNYNALVTIDDGSCAYACNASVIAPTINHTSCGADGTLSLNGLSNANAVQYVDFVITPNPLTGTGTYTGSSSNAGSNYNGPYFSSVHAGTYTIDYTEGPGCNICPPTGCTASTTFTVNAPVFGCLDPNADNYDASTTCDQSQEDYCCYTVGTSYSLPSGAPSSPSLYYTSGPTADDASIQLDITGLPPANALSTSAPGGAVVEFRITGYGNAIGYSGPGSGSTFTNLAPAAFGSSSWETIVMGVGNVPHGAYIIEVRVNTPQNTNNSCVLQQFNLTIIPG